MEKGSKTLLKGFLLVLTLALAKESTFNVDETNRMLFMGAVTALTLVLSNKRFITISKDGAGGGHNIKKSSRTFPVLAGDTLNTIQSTLSQLTPGEMDVLDFMGKGLMNNEIANKLRVSEASIKNYINSILSKLNAGFHSKAAVTAIKQGFANLKNNFDFYNFHKGALCLYKPILCQEGWCFGCAVYQKRATE